MAAELEVDLTLLKSARGFFGHQSVGRNILAGVVETIQRAAGGKLPVLALGEVGELPDACIIHSAVGKNREPRTKCNDFGKILDRGLADKIDYALLKFCYIDINEETDTGSLFSYYSDFMDGLKARYPGITFIHVTVPLRHTPGGPSVWIREVMGRPNRSKLANIKRNEFNQLLRRRYSRDQIFDLAASESTHQDGGQELFRYRGGTYSSLIAEYTDDGGHLNSVGRRHVAADFISSVARAVKGGKSVVEHAR